MFKIIVGVVFALVSFTLTVPANAGRGDYNVAKHTYHYRP
jgi:hypothetical protein